jgi:hypothetical protein
MTFFELSGNILRELRKISHREYCGALSLDPKQVNMYSDKNFNYYHNTKNLNKEAFIRTLKINNIINNHE